MSNPQIPNDALSGAVDLGKVKEDAARAKAEDEARALAAAQIIAARWDKAMTRAFKGIVSAPTRRRFLLSASKREDA